MSQNTVSPECAAGMCSTCKRKSCACVCHIYDAMQWGTDSDDDEPEDEA